MAAISKICIIWKKIQITDPHKVWVSGFLSVRGNGISASTIMKKSKNGHHFVNVLSIGVNKP